MPTGNQVGSPSACAARLSWCLLCTPRVSHLPPKPRASLFDRNLHPSTIRAGRLAEPESGATAGERTQCSRLPVLPGAFWSRPPSRPPLRETELRGPARHCFGGRKLLRQGRVAEWRRRRAGNALFAGETGNACGNEVVRTELDAGRLERKLPAGLRPFLLGAVRFPSKLEDDLRACIEARTPVSWRVELRA